MEKEILQPDYEINKRGKLLAAIMSKETDLTDDAPLLDIPLLKFLADENRLLKERNKELVEAIQKMICDDGEFRDADTRYEIGYNALQNNNL